MAYKCVHCSKQYDDGSEALLKGCDECGRKFFFYLRKEQVEKIQKEIEKVEEDLNEEEKDQIEQDVREIAGIDDDQSPVFLDFESVKVLKPGKYLLDISKLFAMDKPRVYRLEDGKYIVDLAGVGRASG